MSAESRPKHRPCFDNLDGRILRSASQLLPAEVRQAYAENFNFTGKGRSYTATGTGQTIAIIENLAFLSRQYLGFAMEVGPGGEATRVVGIVRKVGPDSRGGGTNPVKSGVASTQAMSAGIAPGQVKQLAADLHRPQPEEISQRR